MNTETDTAVNNDGICLKEKNKKQKSEVFRALVRISCPDTKGTMPLSSDEVKRKRVETQREQQICAARSGFEHFWF